MKTTALILAAIFLTGCGAMGPAMSAAGFLVSGGTSIYKSEKSYGPKAEFVLIKVEANHIVYQTSPCPCVRTKTLKK